MRSSAVLATVSGYFSDHKQAIGILSELVHTLMAILYYNLRTVFAGSAEPLSTTSRPRSVARTGWGPRGDSGPERGRVRATQPAKPLTVRRSVR